MFTIIRSHCEIGTFIFRCCWLNKTRFRVRVPPKFNIATKLFAVMLLHKTTFLLSTGTLLTLTAIDCKIELFSAVCRHN